MDIQRIDRHSVRLELRGQFPFRRDIHPASGRKNFDNFSGQFVTDAFYAFIMMGSQFGKPDQKIGFFSGKIGFHQISGRGEVIGVQIRQFMVSFILNGFVFPLAVVTDLRSQNMCTPRVADFTVQWNCRRIILIDID